MFGEHMNYPRIMIAAPKSGAGKTTIVCGLLQALLNKGIAPCSFKCGPDYIDPLYHRKVIGIPAGNLDTFFTAPDSTVALFEEEYTGDVAVIEGVMGLYDGVGGVEEAGSCYDLAHVLECPILLVVDAKGAGRSVLAQIKGFLDYDAYGLIRGVILNRISPSFAEVLAPLIEEELGIKCVGALPEEKELILKSRHLGLVLPEEVKNLKSNQEKLKDVLTAHVLTDDILKIANEAGELGKRKVQWFPEVPKYEKPLRLAVARDEAFCFYYRENLTLLEKAGVEILDFSPLREQALPPNICGLLLGGGYPENHLKALSENEKMKAAIREAIEGGLPTLAECGGFMYLLEEMEDADQNAFPMVGALQGRAFWTGRLNRFGYITLTDRTGMQIKAHEFHYYDTDSNGEDCIAEKPIGNTSWPCIHKRGGSYMGFPHLYYPSNTKFVTDFTEAMKAYGRDESHFG